MGKYSGKIRPKIIKTQDFCLLLSYRMKKTMKTPLYINVNGRLMDLSEPQVMGILNVTPDSFYAGSRSETEKDIVQRLHQIIDEGASIIDIGGYSSRPNAEHISVEEEMSRLRNGLEIIRKHHPDAVVSVDTFRADIAKMCVEEYGVAIINDISAGQMDETMFPTIAQLGIPYIIMHMKGTPQDMQTNPTYAHFLKEVFYYFSEKVQKLRDLGVKDIIIDPGFGFGKTLEHNYELMNHLEEFSLFELPLLVGVSRKSMIYKLLETTPEEALNGTTALHTIALLKGTNILRVHDVKEAVESIKIVQKMKTCQAF
jgi:dihydropteroate synthase